MALRGVLYAAEASTHATRHQVFQADFAPYAAIAGHTADGLHHGPGAAGLYEVERFAYDIVVRDKAFCAYRAVFGGQAQASVRAVGICAQQVVGCLAAQQERNAMAQGVQLATQLQQRCRAYSAANQQTSLLARRQCESVAQWKQATQPVALAQMCQGASAFAYAMDEQSYGAGGGVGVVNRNGAPEHRLARRGALHLYELARHNRRKCLVANEVEQHVACVGKRHGTDAQVAQNFLHRQWGCKQIFLFSQHRRVCFCKYTQSYGQTRNLLWRFSQPSCRL